jgi:small subunit ribosomal protein S17
MAEHLSPEERVEQRRRRAAQRRAWRAKQRTRRAGRETQAPAQQPAAHGPGRPKVRQGIVVSAKPNKTITVRIDVTRRHRFYKKIVRESTTLHAHDERNEAHEGDTVRIVESRPISRTKRWRLVDVLERSR